MTIEEALDPSNVGDICHIVPRGEGGPRADPSFPAELVNSYGNLLVLCKIHHKIVDDHPDIYPVDELRRIKAAHEQWVDSTLSIEQKAELAAKEEYAGILLDWETRGEIARWSNWANRIVSWYPQIFIEDADKFSELETWANTRWWPNTLPVLDAAFLNYSKWISLMLHVLYRRTEKQGDLYFTRKFYQISEWDEEKYERLHNVWLEHLKLLESMMIEVCKAANLIASLVRRHILPAYRQSEGKFALQDTFASSPSVFGGVFEYRAPDIGDGLIYQRSELYQKVLAREL